MKRCKVSNPEIDMTSTIPMLPPPVPTRPASYTPSTHDSLNTLNNFDTVRNYGSAADELESTGIQNLPTFQEYLQTFHGPHNNIPPALVPLLPSNHGSETDSIQKEMFDFEYPNIMDNYTDGKCISDNCYPACRIVQIKWLISANLKE